MTIMSAWTILVLFKTRLLFTAFGCMGFFGMRIFMTRFGIDVSSTKLLTTFPAPRPATTATYEKVVIASRKPARKNIITRIIFQAPPLAPGALFGVHLR